MKSTFFTANRRRSMDAVDSGLFVLTAYSLQQEHNDVAFPFRQESNFYYLTGIVEPDWILVIDSKTREEYLIAPDIDSVHEVFEGSTSHAAITSQSGISKILPRKAFPELLKKMAVTHDRVHTLGAHPWKKHFNFSVNPAQGRLDTLLRRYFKRSEDCRALLSKQRAIKQPEEIEHIKQAIAVTGEALGHAADILASLAYEHELEAEITYYIKKQGLNHAYQPIIASGKNACTLHHSAKGEKLEADKPILIDVGAQAAGYAADISRTFAYGQHSERQRQVYDQLHQTHQKIISLLKPNLSIKEYVKQSDKQMKAAVTLLGLAEDKYRTYFPHAISHGLGLDVHESLGGYDNFMPGMVLTVEPGIYIPEEGIGMRIEDDILITDDGNQNLSAGISTEFIPSSIINR